MSTRSIAGRTAALLLLLPLASACRDEMPTAATFSGPSHGALSWFPPVYTATDLGTLGMNTAARAINAHGEVAGDFGSVSWGGRAFRWTAQGGLEDLGTPGGGPDERVMVSAINDAGTIVGSSGYPDRRAFSLSRSGEWQDLSQLWGQRVVEAASINNRGEIVGKTESGAFLYRPGVGMMPLKAPAGWGTVINAADARNIYDVPLQYHEAGLDDEVERDAVAVARLDVAVHAVVGDVELAAHEPLGVGCLPLKHLFEGLAPDELLVCLPGPEFFWGVDRLGVESFVSGITPKISLGFELGRRPEFPGFPGH